MTRALSNDLRQRVLASILAGERCRQVAARFEIAVLSVVKWSQRYRSTGSIAPGKMGGHRRRILEPHRAFIAQCMNETPHLTLHRLQDELAARGVIASHNTIWHFLRRIRSPKAVCPDLLIGFKSMPYVMRYNHFPH